MKRIRIDASRAYDVLLGGGLLHEVGSLVKPIVKGRTVALVTDSNVAALYGARISEALTLSGYAVVTFVFPAGEESKTAETYVGLLEFLAENRLTRQDAVVALGGGVTGDMAGFAAATYLRGVALIQIPTTLLAMVDSSVGGKTAIDLKQGKNLVGAFYQPALVITDTDTLKTLPEAQLACGMAEVIKTGVLSGGRLWRLLKAKPPGIADEEIIELCICYKRDVVKADEFENGARALLNLGHTVGHAVEKLSGFTVPHGEAVSIGLAKIAEAGVKNGTLEAAACAEIIAMLKKENLPVASRYTLKELTGVFSSDKKSERDAIKLIVINGIGDCGIMRAAWDKAEEYLA
ncbi:MAG: 3-dehydroquinate synthase [Clostridiales bacterium]|jgi:3-dehydroquinate synthase|nr:3-dehydroquinate synthase [Clostridiales bacterium]